MEQPVREINVHVAKHFTDTPSFGDIQNDKAGPLHYNI